MSGRSIAPLEMNSLAWHGEPWRLITSALPHVGWIHLIFNLSWMWVFGTLIEERLGPIRLLALILLLAAAS
jgi:membrane associated rhomboid family serine protease